jgi:hypothetical protein
MAVQATDFGYVLTAAADVGTTLEVRAIHIVSGGTGGAVTITSAGKAICTGLVVAVNTVTQLNFYGARLTDVTVTALPATCTVNVFGKN